MKYCQGPSCHTYRTKDRIRGSKGDKHYETRKRTSMYYGKGNFCCQTCLYDWTNKHIEHALDHFGRIHEPKRLDCDNAWYKDYDYQYNPNGSHRVNHRFVNDLLGEKIAISQVQYEDRNYTEPFFSSATKD